MQTTSMTNTSNPQAVELQYTALERISVSRPVDRVPAIAERCSGRKVLDLGALDETAYLSKQGQGDWLHQQIAQVASRVVGVDNSTLVPEEGLRPFQNSVIVNRDIFNLKAVIDEHGAPDVVVAGELLEHLADAAAFLTGLRRDLPPGTEVVLTTPNACSWHNVILGLFSRESMHPGHVAVHSYKTLNTLFRNAGFSSWQLQPYHVHFTEMIQASKGVKRISASILERVVRGLETAFPILSCGWVCRIRV